MHNSEPRPILTAADVTEEVLNDVWGVVEGWYMDQPVDWEDVLERVEKGDAWDFGTQMDSPAINKIKRTIRKWKSEASE